MSCKGYVKSFSAEKGWGFIVMNGEDVFVHMKDCKTRPKVGDEVWFDVEDSPAKPGQKKACNVTGGSSCQGTVRSFSTEKGWGFVDNNGVDLFLHIKNVIGNCPVKGDTVIFDVEVSTDNPDKMTAKRITGGSGEPVGKGKGKGQDSGYDSWGSKDASSGGGGGYGSGGSYGPSWDNKGNSHGGGPYSGGNSSWDSGKKAEDGGKDSWQGGNSGWQSKDSWSGSNNSWNGSKDSWSGGQGYRQNSWGGSSGDGPVVPGTSTYIAELPLETTEESIDSIFGAYGVITAKKLLDPGTRGKRACIITWDTVETATWIVENMNGNAPKGLTEPIVAKYKDKGSKFTTPGGGAGNMGGSGMDASLCVFVGDLPGTIDQAGVQGIFGAYGNVTSVRMVTGRNSGAAALVNFSRQDEAQWVVDNLDQQTPPGFTAPIRCAFKTPKEGGKGGGGKGWN